MSQSYDALLFLTEWELSAVSSGYCTLSGEYATGMEVAACNWQSVIQFSRVLP